MKKIKRLNTNKEKHKRIKLLTLFRKDGHCRYCSRIRGVAQKRPPCLKSVTDIINNETCYSYTLPKQDPKSI